MFTNEELQPTVTKITS